MPEYEVIKRFWQRQQKRYYNPGDTYSPMSTQERDRLLDLGCLKDTATVQFFGAEEPDHADE